VEVGEVEEAEEEVPHLHTTTTHHQEPRRLHRHRRRRRRLRFLHGPRRGSVLRLSETQWRRTS
jgi:hypothetical protein